MSRSLKSLCLLLVLSLALGACNRAGLAYRNLDVIIPWSLSDYLDMNREQKDWFNVRLKQHLDWHCATQLPVYLTWLDRLQAMVESNQVDDAGLQARTAEAKQAIAQIARQVTPSAIELLRELNDQQVEEMNQALAKDLNKRKVEYLQPSVQRQIEQRAERMNKRLTAWMGKLSPTQQERVEAWSNALGEQNKQWIGNRGQWQALFSEALAQRQSPDFPKRMEQLLEHRESLWTPEYRLAYNQTEEAARSLLVDLMAQSTPTQRQRLIKKIAETRKDFGALKCLQTAKQQ